MVENINYYSVECPIINELVLVTFNLNCSKEGFFKGKLIEYPKYMCIMNHQDATKKKKIISWHKIVTLNKNIVVKVDNIDNSLKIIQVSITYLNENCNLKNNTPGLAENIQIQLMEYFQENKLLSQFINTLCITHNYNYEYLWKNLIYYIDGLRKEYNLQNSINISIWSYFNKYIDNLDVWLNNYNLNDDYKINILKLLNKKNDITYHKIITKIGIISLNSILDVKEMFNKILNDINFKYILKYESTPYYTFESFSNDSNITDHELFINNLNNYITNKQIFIKIDFLAKII
jgi:translation initiation factor 2 alpha subunit (eIF-2alpha)